MLHDQRELVGVTLRILKWREQSGLSRWVQCNHKALYKGERGGSQKFESRAAVFEDRAGGRAKEYSLRVLEKARKQILL